MNEPKCPFCLKFLINDMCKCEFLFTAFEFLDYTFQYTKESRIYSVTWIIEGNRFCIINPYQEIEIEPLDIYNITESITPLIDKIFNNLELM